MVKDRLNELRTRANLDTQVQLEDDDENEEVSIRMPFKPKKKNSTTATTKGGPMGEFFSEVASIQENIEAIRLKVTEIQKLQAGIISSPHTSESSRKTLDVTTNEIQTLSRTVHKQLTDLNERAKEDEKENEEHKKKGEGDIHQADLRMKRTMHSSLVDKFKETMKVYAEGQVRYQEQMKNLMKRTIKIANNSMTDEEIDKALEDNIEPQVFAQQYMANMEKAKLDLRELEERHQDLLKLEKSIQEVSCLFHDIAVLVTEQGDRIDTIDRHVKEAKDYVESAVKQSQKGVASRKKFQKRKLCIIGIATIAGLILAILITLGVVFR